MHRNILSGTPFASEKYAVYALDIMVGRNSVFFTKQWMEFISDLENPATGNSIVCIRTRFLIDMIETTKQKLLKNEFIISWKKRLSLR